MSNLLFIGSRVVDNSATIDLVKLDNVDTIPTVLLLKALYVKISIIGITDIERQKEQILRIKEYITYLCGNSNNFSEYTPLRLEIMDLYDDIKIVDNNFKEVDVFKFNKK